MDPLKLLIVEDDTSSLDLMAEVFSGLLADVCAVGESKKAADMVSTKKFDGIFVDLEMPKLTGLELVNKIRYSPRNRSTPVVVVTGNDEHSSIRQAFSTGAMFILEKPVDRRKLEGLYCSVRGAMLENRRKSFRIPIHADVTCTVGPRTTHGRTWNLSRGGMQVEATGLKIGDTVHLSFGLPGAGFLISAYGLVVWVKPDRQGIQFTKMSYKNEQEIREFMISAEN